MLLEEKESYTKQELIDALLENSLTPKQLHYLKILADEDDLAQIIQRIYDLNDDQVMKIAALEGVTSWVDVIKNGKRNRKFINKINSIQNNIGFRDDIRNKVILAEGDSWFNYPVILTDVIDWISMENNMAVYSLASGGDWLLNMLSARKYVEQLSTIHPDVFLISGGGNDLVGKNRLAAVVDPTGTSVEYDNSVWAQQLFSNAKHTDLIGYNETTFKTGVKYLSKDFFALLMFFHLQYYFLINGILTGRSKKTGSSKFPGIQIITQGYDYAIPSHDKGWEKPWRWYKPFIRKFLGHGTWLKTPLQIRGIYDSAVQKAIVYSMIFLFNEMMIETGRTFNEMLGSQRVCHIDSRNSVGEFGWTDELHPLPEHFKRTGQAFINCIKGGEATYDHVYIVNQIKYEY